ncbi:MAG: hypothetical protein GY822_23445 [Deltaproteobacteria bacterium]|nr:hypothetical protein [Deltaproteobacteria bacterium]
MTSRVEKIVEAASVCAEAGVPQRGFFPWRAKPKLTDVGFLSEEPPLRADELLKNKATLVLAPPWCGKTHTAGAIVSWAGHSDRNVVYTHLGNEVGSPSFQDDVLKQLEVAQNIFWVVDAVDDGERLKKRTSRLVSSFLKRLSDEQRKQLTVLLFCREAEVPEGFEKELTAALEVEVQHVHLAPLSVGEAQALLGPSYDATADFILKHKFQSISSYPAGLLALASVVQANAQLQISGTADAWRHVLKELMREKNPDRVKIPQETHEERFRIACKIAAMCLLTGTEELVDEAYAGPVDHTIAGFCPVNIEAAWRTMRGAIGEKTTRGMKFAHPNVRDWLAAFALVDAEVSQRNLVSLLQPQPDKLLPPYKTRGLMHCLHEILPSLRDKFLSNLDEVLNKIEQAASKTSERLLPRVLDDTPYPNLGKKLAERIQDSTKLPQVRATLLALAGEHQAEELGPIALVVLQDLSSELVIADEAALYLANHALADLQPVFPNLITSNQDRLSPQYFSMLVWRAFKDKTISYIEACILAPAKDPGLTDLRYYLLDDLKTPPSAEDLLALLNVINSESEEIAQELLLSVFENLVEAESPLLDEDMVIQAFIDCGLPYLEDHDLGLKLRLEKTVSQKQMGRRALYYKWASSEEDETIRYGWRFVVSEEDLDWLEQLANRVPKRDDVFQDLYRVARNAGDTIRLTRLNKNEPRLFLQLKKEFEKVVAQRQQEEARWSQRKKERENRAPERLQLRSQVEAVLKGATNDRALVHHLGWHCFVEAGMRPTNVDGRFEDLPRGLINKTFAKLEEALLKIEPTPRPTGSSFPMAILYESATFAAVMKWTSLATSIDTVLLAKWVKSVSLGSTGEAAVVIEAAARYRPDAVIAGISEALLYQLDSDQQYATAGHLLPDELWVEAFTQPLEAKLSHATPASQAERFVLKLIAERAPASAMRIAECWRQA